MYDDMPYADESSSSGALDIAQILNNTPPLTIQIYVYLHTEKFPFTKYISKLVVATMKR